MNETETLLDDLDREIKAAERELHTLEARLSQVEAALEFAEGRTDDSARDKVRGWIASEAQALIDVVQGGRKGLEDRPLIVHVLRNDGPIVPAGLLDPIMENVERFAESALLVESAIDEACERVESSVSTLIENGDQAIGGIEERCQGFTEGTGNLLAGVNAELDKKLKNLVPEELAKAFVTFEEFISDAEKVLDRAESLLDGEIGKAVDFVGGVKEVIAPVVPLLEPVQELA
jgi:hypothetical protein